jgi:hypothetical protein
MMKNKWIETDDITQIRVNSLLLLTELEKWDIRPYRRQRVDIVKTIKFTYNMKRLHHVHDMLLDLKNSALMNKLAQGL